jgi:hypothetical protein
VCEAVQGLTDGFTSVGDSGGDDAGDDAMPSSAEFDKAEDGLNGRARLLFFHGDLKEATHGLADDIASIKHLTQKDPGDPDVTEMLTVAVSIDSHARKAQRACGLPERSLLARPA